MSSVSRGWDQPSMNVSMGRMRLHSTWKGFCMQTLSAALLNSKFVSNPIFVLVRCKRSFKRYRLVRYVQGVSHQDEQFLSESFHFGSSYMATLWLNGRSSTGAADFRC